MGKQANWHTRGFFGVHYDLHANENDAALGRDATFDHIYEELGKIKADFVQYDCKGHPGYAGYPTKVGTPAPGIVGDALDVWRQVTRRLGIPLSVHYSGLWDEVAMGKHPEWAQVNADGSRKKERACCNSRYVDELMIPQMLEVIDWYDVDGFWVDGDAWVAAPCYCPSCKALFEAEAGVGEPPKSEEDPNWQRWLAFHRTSYENHVRKYARAVHEKKPECLVCVNWLYSIRQPEDVRLPVDYLSGDFSHSFGLEVAAAEGRFLDSRGVPWNLMAWGSFSVGRDTAGWTYPGWTFKSAEHLKQEAAEAIANGGSLFVYDVPQRSGHLVSWRQDLLAEVAEFCRERQGLCQDSKSIPQVALLHDSSDYYARNVPLYQPGDATEPLNGALQALLENHYHTDILNDATLQRRFGEYPLVVIPEPRSLSAELVAATKEYVQQGGNVVVSGAHAPRVLGEVLGVSVEGEPESATYALPAGQELVSVSGLWQRVKLDSARAICHLHAGDEPTKDQLEAPAATANSFGKGKAIGIYGPVFQYFFQSRYPRLRRALGEILQEVSDPRLLSMSAPARVEIALRSKGNLILLHLINRGAGHPLSPRNAAVEDIPPVGPINVSLPLHEEPKKVYLAPDERGLISTWQSGRLQAQVAFVVIHNVLVVET